jgi:S1-C subfamily serine protease
MLLAAGTKVVAPSPVLADPATGPSALCVVRASRGTARGFALVRPEWIVTARHTVTGQAADRPIGVLFDDGRSLAARVAFRHPRVDLALLELLEPSRWHRPFWPGGCASGTEGRVFVGSRPRGSAELGNGRSWAMSEVTFERTTRHRDGYEEQLFMFRAPAIGPGDSGGPLLDATGAVAGVVTDGIDIGDEQYVRATSIAPLLEHLGLTLRGRGARRLRRA